MPSRQHLARKSQRNIWKAGRPEAEARRRKQKAIRMRKLAAKAK